MARLIAWAPGLQYITMEPLSGPRTIGSGASQSIGGYTQSVASPFGLWRWKFGFAPMRGDGLRRYRGMVAALHGGANAVRVPIYDPDMITNVHSLGIGNVNGVTFDNGLGWRIGGTSRPFRVSRSPVALTMALSVGSTNVSLDPSGWGGTLDVGSYISFWPDYFGLHVVTQVYAPGEYKVWPPVRRARTTSDYATLDPVLAMRLESEEAGATSRGQWLAEGLTLTMVEVEDADVRSYFADAA